MRPESCKQFSSIAERNELRPAARNKRRNGLNSKIVPYSISEAKAKFGSAHLTDGVASAILAFGLKNPMAMSALVDLVCSDNTAKVVAERYSLNPSSLHFWSKRVGLPLRQRGRRSSLEPTAKNARILKFVRAHGITGAARRIGLSKQRVYWVVCRWEPELRGRRSTVKPMVVPRPSRSPARNIIVCFRISTDEWQRLLTAAPVDGENKKSGFSKARAIVLKYISGPGNGGHDKNMVLQGFGSQQHQNKSPRKVI